MGRHSRYFNIILLVAAFALKASAAPNLPRLADKSPGAVAVDVELVIAVDVSYSMDPDEQALQREGYVLALTSREFLRALREGGSYSPPLAEQEAADEGEHREPKSTP